MPFQEELYPGAFRELLDGLPHAVLVFDDRDKVIFVNGSAQELLSRRSKMRVPDSARQLRGILGPLNHLDGRRLKESEHPQARLERGERFQDYELRAAERWGSSHPVFSFSGRVHSDSSSARVQRVLVVEEASVKHETEQLFRTVFERGPVPVSLVRGSDQCVLDVNPAFLDLLGYQREEVVKHTVPELAMVLNPEKLQGARERIERGEEVEKLELVVRGRDDSPRTLLSWHRWVELGGEECLLGVYVDISEQKEMERRLHEATEVVLQSASMFSRSVVQQLERLRDGGANHRVTGDLDLLTRRERDVVTRVGAGQSNLRIAQELSLTPQTVRNYVTRIYRKIGVENRAEAVVWARERGLVQG